MESFCRKQNLLPIGFHILCRCWKSSAQKLFAYEIPLADTSFLGFRPQQPFSKNKERGKNISTYWMRVSSRFSESMISCLEVGLHRRHLCKFANTDCFVASVETCDVTGPDIPPALLTASDILRNTGNRMPFPRKPK